NQEERLPVALAVFAARSLACFRTTDNLTWLRKGGITPKLSVRDAMLQALASWLSFAEEASKLMQLGGSLSIATWNAGDGRVRDFGLMNGIVVSPPYANRLDYSSLWAPETAVLSAI